MLENNFYKSIIDLGRPYFESLDLNKLEDKLSIYSGKTEAFFACVIQENNQIKLDVSFINPTSVIDFSLQKNLLEVHYLPIPNITFIKETFTENGMTLIINTNSTSGIYYRTFNQVDTIKLKTHTQFLTQKLGF